MILLFHYYCAKISWNTYLQCCLILVSKFLQGTALSCFHVIVVFSPDKAERRLPTEVGARRDVFLKEQKKLIPFWQKYVQQIPGLLHFRFFPIFTNVDDLFAQGGDFSGQRLINIFNVVHRLIRFKYRFHLISPHYIKFCDWNKFHLQNY